MGHCHVEWGLNYYDCTDSPCTSYPDIPVGTPVTFQAYAYAGHAFSSWSSEPAGWVSCGSSSCTVLMPAGYLNVWCHFIATGAPSASCSWWWSGGTAEPQVGCTLKPTITWGNAVPRTGNCVMLELWAPGASGPLDSYYTTSTSGSHTLNESNAIQGTYTAYAYLWDGAAWDEFIFTETVIVGNVVIAELNPPPQSSYDVGPYAPGQQNVNIASLSIKNVGTIAGTLSWQCYIYANETGQTLLTSGTTINDYGPGQSVQQPQIVDIPTGASGSVTFGVRVKGETEATWPAWGALGTFMWGGDNG